jgi:autotransporter-associated beta strand protein
MTTRYTAKQCLTFGTILAGTGAFLLPTAAYADCLPDAAGTTVTCNTNDPDGYQTGLNGVTILVQPTATVGTGAGTPSPLLSAGTGSVVNNENLINGGPAGTTAISLGGGSTVNNAATGSGTINGDVLFGAGGANTYNNLGGTATLTGNIVSLDFLNVSNAAAGTVITGDITAVGVNLNNVGTITGDLTSTGASTVTNSGGFNGNMTLSGGAQSVDNSGTVTGDLNSTGNTTVTNSGTWNGNTTLSGGTATVDNSGTENGDLSTAGDTTLTNSGTWNGDTTLTGGTASVDNSGTENGNLSSTGDTTLTNEGTWNGDITTGAGNDTITNTGTLNGNVAMGGGTNVFNADNGSSFPTGTLSADVGSNSTLNLGAGGGTIGAVSNFTTMNVNGTGFGTPWLLTAPITITGQVNANSGYLEVQDADFLDSITVVNNANIADGGGVWFDNTASGTYSGNMSGTGTVYVGFSGAGVTTFSGTNTYTGGTYIDGSTLSVTGGAALADDGEVQISNGGTLDVAETETIGTLNDGLVYGGTGFITLSGGDLNINGGAFSGVISGSGGIGMVGAGTLTLSGANTYTGTTTISDGTLVLQDAAINNGSDIVDDSHLIFDDSVGGTYAGDISGSGDLTKIGAATTTLTGDNTYTGATFINDGVLAVGGTGIGDTSAVTVTSPGALTLLGDETIGSLAGDGNVSGAFALTTGGNDGDTTFSGDISVDTINKEGAGTFNLTGTGTETTGINVDEGTVAIGGDFTSPQNNVADGATLNVLLAGDLTGNITGVAGSTTIINGLVTGNVANAGALSGAGTVVGAVANDGTLSPGNGGIGIFTVNGSYTQSATGTLAVDVAPAATPVAGTDNDQLLVIGTPGTAALDGTLAVTFVPSGTQPFVAGATYDVVDATGGITGDFADVTGLTLSPFISLADTGVVTVSGAEQVYRLTVVRTPYAVGIASGATPNQIAVANGFQGLVTGATGDAAALVSAVDVMTVPQAQLFFDEASPEPYAAYVRALLNQGELFSRQIHLQTHENPNLLPGFDLWIRGYGGWGKARDDSFRIGSKIDAWGIAGGATYRWTDFYIGGALGWSKDKVDYALGNSNGDNKSWQAGLYGGWQGGPWSADLQVDYVHGSMSADRTINVATVVRHANADTKSHLWKFVGTFGYDGQAGRLHRKRRRRCEPDGGQHRRQAVRRNDRSRPQIEPAHADLAIRSACLQAQLRQVA